MNKKDIIMGIPLLVALVLIVTMWLGTAYMVYTAFGVLAGLGYLVMPFASFVFMWWVAEACIYFGKRSKK